MLVVHYTVYRRIDLTEDKAVTLEGSEALGIIKALAFEFGELDSLSLPCYSPELGVTIEAVEVSDDPRVEVTFKKDEAPNEP